MNFKAGKTVFDVEPTVQRRDKQNFAFLLLNCLFVRVIEVVQILSRLKQELDDSVEVAVHHIKCHYRYQLLKVIIGLFLLTFFLILLIFFFFLYAYF